MNNYVDASGDLRSTLYFYRLLGRLEHYRQPKRCSYKVVNMPMFLRQTNWTCGRSAGAWAYSSTSEAPTVATETTLSSPLSRITMTPEVARPAILTVLAVNRVTMPEADIKNQLFVGTVDARAATMGPVFLVILAVMVPRPPRSCFRYLLSSVRLP